VVGEPLILAPRRNRLGLAHEKLLLF